MLQSSRRLLREVGAESHHEVRVRVSLAMLVTRPPPRAAAQKDQQVTGGRHQESVEAGAAEDEDKTGTKLL